MWNKLNFGNELLLFCIKYNCLVEFRVKYRTKIHLKDSVNVAIIVIVRINMYNNATNMQEIKPQHRQIQSKHLNQNHIRSLPQNVAKRKSRSPHPIKATKPTSTDCLVNTNWNRLNHTLAAMYFFITFNI